MTNHHEEIEQNYSTRRNWNKPFSAPKLCRLIKEKSIEGLEHILFAILFNIDPNCFIYFDNSSGFRKTQNVYIEINFRFPLNSYFFYAHPPNFLLNGPQLPLFFSTTLQKQRGGVGVETEWGSEDWKKKYSGSPLPSPLFSQPTPK